MTQLSGRRILTATAVVATLALGVAGCGTIPQAGGSAAPGTGTRSASQQPSAAQSSETRPDSTPSTTPTPDPVTFTPNVKNGSKNVQVSTVVTVAAANGTVGAVKLSYRGTDAKGRS